MFYSHLIKHSYGSQDSDHGPAPFIVDMPRAARQNQNFRTAVWTGNHLQMTLMSIPPQSDIGLEIHPDTDQFIRVEEGQALISMGRRQNELSSPCHLDMGEAVFVPQGIWHNIINSGNGPLKLSSIYAPPHHPWGTIHRTKADAEYADY